MSVTTTQRTSDDSSQESASSPADADWPDIALAVRGDSAAFARIVARYQQPLAQQLWRFTRDHTTLQELVQEVFVEAYFSLRGFRGDAPLLHWLRRLATRVGYRFWNRQARVPATATSAELERLNQQSLHNAETDAFESAELVHYLLAKLPPRDRLVLTLLHLEECSVKEIMVRTGWSESLVKVQAHRARQKLEKMLEQLP